jgi:hypothetical protein
MKTPDFVIAQNDKTRTTMIWTREGQWTELAKDDYEVVAMIAKLLRVCPNPEQVLQEIAKANNWIDLEPPP